MKYSEMPFPALVQAAQMKFGYRITAYGENAFKIEDSSGNTLLANPTSREKLESFLKMRLSFRAGE